MDNSDKWIQEIAHTAWQRDVLGRVLPEECDELASNACEKAFSDGLMPGEEAAVRAAVRDHADMAARCGLFRGATRAYLLGYATGLRDGLRSTRAVDGGAPMG